MPIIDGKAIAERINRETKEKVSGLQQPPRLAAVVVGPESEQGAAAKKFLEMKKKRAEEIGIECRIYEFPQNITTQQLRKKIVEIAKAGVNDGVLIELPLPPAINAQYILNTGPEEKDVDVFSQNSQGAFFAGRPAILPPAVEAVKQIFRKYGIEPKGKNCAVFGYGLLVGKPVSHWLAQQGATVSIINEFTREPEKISREADVVISGAGKPNLITGDMIKEGSVVIDFGYENSEGKIAGDVDFEAVKEKAGLITPVPGGIGPIVIAALFKNLIELIKK